jgi:hypothetical protein
MNVDDELIGRAQELTGIKEPAVTVAAELER